MISLDVKSGKRLHQLSNLKMEIGEAGVSNDFATAVINIEVNTEQHIIKLRTLSDTAGIVGSKILLILSLQPLNGLVFSSYTDIIEVMRGV
jgi:hypothetical protein